MSRLVQVYEAVTENVVVRVRPTYLPQQSDPDGRRWVWAYAIEIENLRPEAVQLLARHWTITDALGRTEEVRGPGVVGEQPVIPPDGVHRYASGCPLSTPSGSMVGTYSMADATGRVFTVAIPAFSLDSETPRQVN
ncbi:Co2+/Mg2+ efflux protein ApaG [Brevundimonas sp.]|uniref:Co2+/Mg2+ efflux protein ApaG n=1 Tax=Brevundimonas sp. TaxID=1871086 RepID=UPI0025D17EE9|nr:Co2+/Mg2+ efflux protein ApaG [Brevundimonas sp.]